jgi:hypothetical protein
VSFVTTARHVVICKWGLQIWRVNANIFNNRRITEKGGPICWGLGGELKTSHPKIPVFYTSPRTSIVSLVRHELWKIDMTLVVEMSGVSCRLRFVKSPSKLPQYKLDLLGRR